jgi:hypothetical protein
VSYFCDSWIKTFSDNTQEIGTDLLIRNNLASWTNGRLDDIVEVDLYMLPLRVNVKIENTEYYQFDRYSAQVEINSKIVPTRVGRAIQAKITNEHVGKYLLYNIIRNNAYLVITARKTKNSILITNKLVDQWATVSLTKQGFFFDICPKGKAKWGQVST